MQTKILLIDDDRDLVDLLSFALRRAGFSRVLAAYDAPTALKLLEQERPELAILEVKLGTSNGFDLLREMRHRSQLPIVILSGRNDDDDVVLGFELGANDYVTKPFSMRELVARVRAHLRSRGQDDVTPGADEALLEVGPITLNLAEHAAACGERPIKLTVTEFRLLRYLMTNAGSVVPTRVVLKQVWGYDDPGGADVVRATMYRLRRKLDEDPAQPRLLHTVPGVGVMLKPVAYA